MGSPAPDESLWLLLWGHRERLLRIARRRCASAQEAEDIVSEAIARSAAFSRLDRARVGPLLTSVTIRLCVDRERSLAAERRAAPRLCGPDTDLGQVDRLLEEEEARWLERHARLTPIEAAVVDARGAGDRPAQIAADLGVTLKAVESALTRARRKVVAAWKITLGLLGWHHWRRPRTMAPTTGAAALVASAAVVACGLAYLEAWRPVTPYPPAGPTPTAVLDYEPASQPTPVRARSGGGAARPPSVASNPASGRDEEVVVVPYVTVGPARHEGTVVVVDDDEPPEQRLRRCVSNGVEVRLPELQVVCRE